jgi:hypothetical protein
MPEVKCELCSSEASVAYCDGCLDEIKDKEYERGRIAGREEAEEKEEEIIEE